MKSISAFYCLLCATWRVGASINVQGLERGEVQFHCSHTLAWYNQKYLCKDPCKTGEDVLLTVQSGQVVESGRITLVDLGDGHSSVTFSQLRLSDSGRYWCGVDRLGFDTFTEIYLTVKEDFVNEKTTVTPEPSPIWTSPAVSKSTQLTAGMHTSMPTNHSSGEQSDITGIVLCATGGAAALVAILTLCVCFRKRKDSKPQPQVYAISRSLTSADKPEVSSERDGFGKEEWTIKKSTTQTLHQNQDSVTSHIYGNISYFAPTCNTYANLPDRRDFSSMIKPSPPAVYENGGPVSWGKNRKSPLQHV